MQKWEKSSHGAKENMGILAKRLANDSRQIQTAFLDVKLMFKLLRAARSARNTSMEDSHPTHSFIPYRSCWFIDFKGCVRVAFLCRRRYSLIVPPSGNVSESGCSRVSELLIAIESSCCSALIRNHFSLIEYLTSKR